ncbi:hypothetical protein [Streptomyces sp. NPDC056982]|uniref:hypothetical protein n=1 Tax=Streptomyces sp. NPDC056982 TaxID=3345986 RepID=UPI003642DE13
MPRSPQQVRQQVVRGVHGGGCRRSRRGQGGAKPDRRHFGHVEIVKKGQGQQEAGGRVFNTSGRRGGAVSEAHQLAP